MKKLLLILLLFPLYLLAQQDSLPANGHYFTALDGTRIYYEVQGDGEPIILIHGFMNTAENWKKKPVYDSLVKSGYKVITLDLRGNGRSDKPHTDTAYANDAEARTLCSLQHFSNCRLIM